LMMIANATWMLLGAAVAAWWGLGAVAAGHAIMFKRDPRSTVIWVLLSFSIPLLGPWLYWRWGINRVERRAVRHLGRRERPFVPQYPGHDPSATAPHEAAVGHLLPLQRVADRITRLPLLPGNALLPLHNGEQAYPVMLEAIAQASRSVTLASYIFDWDEVGHRFADALAAAARRGVRVHVLFDGVGALGSFSRMGRRLLRSGAEEAAFFPLRFPFGRARLHLRNHRKILVVDGHRGFTGGMNISSRYLLRAPTLADVQRPAGDSPPPPGQTGGPPPIRGRVEDLHFEVRGPVVGEMQHTFVEDWALATDRVLDGPDYYPEFCGAGPALCRGISSGPDQDFEILHWILQAAFASAQHSVWIATPYFIPTSALIAAMVTAALRGVRITLLLPAVVDHPYMRWAADAYLWQLLERGIRVFRRTGHFVHTKLLIVDDRWVLLGSANLDRRSFRLNFEFNLEAYDAVLAGKLRAWLEGMAAGLEPVTLEQMDSRPRWQRLRDGCAKMLSPYL